MNKSKYIIVVLIYFFSSNSKTYGQADYLSYHKEVIECEQNISEHKYIEAIAGFDSLFSRFKYEFLRDIQVATQLSVFEQDSLSAYNFIQLGISRGWSLKNIKKIDFPDLLKAGARWEMILSDYDSLHKQYEESLNQALRQEVHDMYRKDQKKAVGALFRIGQKSQDKYAEKKFAPHSEKQLEQLNEIFDQYGYPGERLIGNNWWTSVILSHHNSISKDYNSKDTLYCYIKPKLMNALKKGELSNQILATIEDWRTAALNGHSLTSYGFLGGIPNDSILEIVNENRSKIGMRSIELRNTLIDIEKETGLNLYLPKDWQKGKIMVDKIED